MVMGERLKELQLDYGYGGDVERVTIRLWLWGRVIGATRVV